MTVDEPGNWQPLTGGPGSHEHRTAPETTDVVAVAQAWLAQDPDPRTRDELAALLAAGDTAALADRFGSRLEFGTAGLRGELGAGPNRMNRVVVLQAAAGLAAYLSARQGPSAVVVGFDARRMSDQFAADTAAAMTGAGHSAMVLDRPLPTPVLAFAIRHLGAAAGVMVTASHNPPRDNGYKVYLGDGCQIVPPADEQIAAEIAAVPPVSTLPLGTEWTTLSDADVLEPYLDAVARVAGPGPRDLRIVYTPMHGVGGPVFLAALARAGFPPPHVVVRQAEPDPDFPTVPFPNPEEPGAIDLALEAARQHGADLVIANDPDADRCAAAIPTRRGWRMLRGDEVGALLGEAIAEREPPETGTFAASVVSSSLLARVAEAHGRRYVDTLTGFKWIARAEGLRFGYEEAIGYCVDPGSVKDKDGISAALLVCDLAARLKAEGRTLQDALDDLARRYGLHATDQLSFRVADLTLIAQAMARLRSHPPSSLGGRAVEQVDDLGEGAGGLPPTEGLRYRLADRGRVVVRPSGTEPKLKCYLEVVLDAGADVDATRDEAQRQLDAIKRDLAAALGL